MTSARSYHSCAREAGIQLESALEECRSYIAPFCGNRLGDMEIEDGPRFPCTADLKGTGDLNSGMRRHASRQKNSVRSQAFEKYDACLSNLQPHLRRCAEAHLDRKCAARNLKAIKTVRLTINDVKTFLVRHPNSKVIHLFRHPMGVVHSRLQHSWTIGRKSSSNLTAGYVAHAYCTILLKNLRSMSLLGSSLEGRAKNLLYEDFVENPMRVTEQMFRFIGADVPRIIRQRFSRIAKGDALHDGIRRSQKWRHFLTSEDKSEVRKHCHQIAHLWENANRNRRNKNSTLILWDQVFRTNQSTRHSTCCI